MSLTAKEEAFAQNWYATKNKTEAYKIAYDAENMSEKTINNKAYAISKKGGIRARYEELSEEGKNSAMMTVKRLNDMYLEAIDMAKLGSNVTGLNQSISGLAKLHGLDRLSVAQIKKIEKEIESSNNMDTEVQPLNITFEVSAPVSDIKVTQGE